MFNPDAGPISLRTGWGLFLDDDAGADWHPFAHVATPLRRVIPDPLSTLENWEQRRCAPSGGLFIGDSTPAEAIIEAVVGRSPMMSHEQVNAELWPRRKNAVNHPIADLADYNLSGAQLFRVGFQYKDAVQPHVAERHGRL